jgi:cell division protein FtsL
VSPTGQRERTAVISEVRAASPLTGRSFARRSALPVPTREPAPPLRLVDTDTRHRSRALTRAATALVGLLATGGLFLVVFLHVLLTQGQADLDRLHDRADAEAARNRRLRVEVAELESPSRVVTAARERLGMVPPQTVTYLPAADPARPLPPVSGVPLGPPAPTVPKPAAPKPARSPSATAPPTTAARRPSTTVARSPSTTVARASKPPVGGTGR